LTAADQTKTSDSVNTSSGAQPRSAITQQILEAPPLPLLVRMASPNAIAFVVQASVGMAEIGFIGRLGTAPLAALALMFPMLMLMQMLANGALGGAVSSAIARAIGSGNPERAELLIWHALAIALIGGVSFTLLYLLFGQSILASFGVNAETTQAAGDYASIVFPAAIVLWIAALLSAVFRGMGNMRFPAVLMVVGAVIQIPLSAALILGWFGAPRLEIKGAAIAVITVAVVNSAILAVRLLSGHADLKLNTKAIHFQWPLFADIFRIGALAALAPLFTVATISIINGLVSGFGIATLAGYGIVARIEFLVVPLAFAFGTAMTSMVGINIGAGNVRRAEYIGWIGALCAGGLTGFAGLMLSIFPGVWISLFTDDPVAFQSGELYLRIVGPMFALQGIGLSLFFASQGAGTVLWPVIATILRFVISVGAAYVAVKYYNQGLVFIYVCLGLGMAIYGGVTAGSVYFGAWRQAHARTMAATR
jgi:putative MATE family efflux protein